MLRRLSSPSRRQTLRQRREVAELRRALGGPFAGLGSGHGSGAAFLVYGSFNVAGIIGMLPMLAAASSLGYRLVVLLPAEDLLLTEAYRACGVDEFVFLEDFEAAAPHIRLDAIRQSLTSARQLKNFTYRGCRVGKFCLSTLMRATRLGNLDLMDPSVDAMLRQQLDRSLRAADAAIEIVGRIRPALALFNERGYSPFGEFFDTVLNRGGECIAWNAAHCNDTLILKRYRRDNVDVNHFALSPKSWERVKDMPWSEAKWRRMHDEIVDGYRSGEWFAECATQRDKVAMERTTLAEHLGLNPARKTACVFPHMFWDATFFWGVDLFDNYEHWFTELLRVARENTKVNWVIKIHPANVAKAIRDGYRGEHSELLAIRRTLGELPDHIKLVPPDSKISTLSLLELTDYCLTVRGTIGIEASCFGIRVLTAGTGRYDRRGFTMDFDSAGDYLAALRRLPDLPAMTESEVELARRFAYGTFIGRPTPLSAVRFGFNQELAASAVAHVNVDGRSMLAAPDVKSIAEWIAGGDEDYLELETLGTSVRDHFGRVAPE